MSLPKKFESFLKDRKVKYQVVEHKVVYTAYDLAATLHVEPKTIMKSLLIGADRELVLALVPGNMNLDLGKLKKVIAVAWKKAGTKAPKKVDLASEKMITKKLTRKTGALIPFGSYYKLQTFCDSKLLKENKLLVNTEIFTESLQMTGTNYKKAENPVVGSFSKAKKLPKVKKKK
jgi:Ala-tRNA(Pro) deacylase